MKNAGNASTTLKVSGAAMCFGGDCFATSSQHYATSTFTFGGLEQALSDVATAVSGWLVSAPVSGQWQVTSDLPALPNDDNQISAAAYNGYIYGIGGGAVNTVYFAPINATGSLGAWATTTPFPTTICGHGSVAANGYLFVIGGETNNCGGASTSTVRRALINATGSIGAWATTSPMLAARTVHGVALYNDYVYAAGGNNTSVEFAQISPTGTLSNWTSTTALPDSGSGVFGFFGFTLGNGYAFVVGGTDTLDSSGRTSTTLYAPVSATGSIGAWQRGPNLPVAAYGNKLLYDGGVLHNIEGSTTTVRFLPITANGMSTSTSWYRAPSVTTTTWNFPDALTYRGHGYMVGGGSEDQEEQFLPLSSRDTYWGLAVPGDALVGTYAGTNIFTSVWSP